MRLFPCTAGSGNIISFSCGASFSGGSWSGGLVLLFSVAVAMLLANLPWTAEYYQRVLNIDIALVVRGPGSLIDWMFPRA